MGDAASPGSLGSEASLFASRLHLEGRREGKVRDVYVLPSAGGPPALAIVASDRLSAFDVVMPTPIPGKGRMLTAIAAFWLRLLESRGIVRTHLISTDADDLPESAFGGGATPREQIAGRLTIGRACEVIPVECVVRGYLEGSGWRDYQSSGRVCGVPLPTGLRQCDRLPEPIFTPATKAEQGAHDENISFDRAAAAVGGELMERLRAASLAIYGFAAEYALERGLILADTKFEFGFPLGADGRREAGAEPILIDEALTPDSSRFWSAAEYEPGHAQASFDKQFVREYLETLVDRGDWNKTAPGPELPDAVVEGTMARYREAADRLTR